MNGNPFLFENVLFIPHFFFHFSCIALEFFQSRFSSLTCRSKKVKEYFPFCCEKELSAVRWDRHIPAWKPITWQEQRLLRVHSIHAFSPHSCTCVSAAATPSEPEWRDALITGPWPVYLHDRWHFCCWFIERNSHSLLHSMVDTTINVTNNIKNLQINPNRKFFKVFPVRFFSDIIS